MVGRVMRVLIVIALVPVVLFLAIQLIPVWRLQTTPPVVAEPRWDGPQTRALAQRACFDCHSNETEWPLYTRIAPVSWPVTSDVLRGRAKLNFSEWGGAPARGEAGEDEGAGGGGDGGSLEGDDDMAKVIVDGSMPPLTYRLIHPAARLTDSEKRQLIQGLWVSLR